MNKCVKQFLKSVPDIKQYNVTKKALLSFLKNEAVGLKMPFSVFHTLHQMDTNDFNKHVIIKKINDLHR